MTNCPPLITTVPRASADAWLSSTRPTGRVRLRTTKKRWYVLQTRSRHEKVVARTLHAAGIEHYLPLIEQVKYHGHRKRVVSKPMFSTYLFLRGSVDATYFALSTRRVAKVIPVSDQARLVHELSQIRQVVDLGGELDLYEYLTRGRHVRVTAGPFRDIEGIVEDRPRPSRLVLQVEALGRAMSLEIDASILEPAD